MDLVAHRSRWQEQEEVQAHCTYIIAILDHVLAEDAKRDSKTWARNQKDKMETRPCCLLVPGQPTACLFLARFETIELSLIRTHSTRSGSSSLACLCGGTGDDASDCVGRGEERREA